MEEKARDSALPWKPSIGEQGSQIFPGNNGCGRPLWDKARSLWDIQSLFFPRAREFCQRIWVNGRASSPVLTFQFLAVLSHSEVSQTCQASWNSVFFLNSALPLIAKYKKLINKSLRLINKSLRFSGKYMQYSNKKWQTFNFHLKSAPGAYWKEYGTLFSLFYWQLDWKATANYISFVFISSMTKIK